MLNISRSRMASVLWCTALVAVPTVAAAAERQIPVLLWNHKQAKTPLGDLVMERLRLKLAEDANWNVIAVGTSALDQPHMQILVQAGPLNGDQSTMLTIAWVWSDGLRESSGPTYLMHDAMVCPAKNWGQCADLLYSSTHAARDHMRSQKQIAAVKSADID
jgi:hypothetical protein